MPIGTKDSYKGLSGQVWGSHVYYASTAVAYSHHGVNDRPIALSRDNGPNWRAGNAAAQTITGAGSPAHHRFPVWWTGDGVPLMASVASMVQEAVHDFRAFVHSDCGGHGECPNGGNHVKGQPPPSPNETVPCPTPTSQTLLRWTAHCALGTVVRFHQGDHRFWLRDETTQSSARNYLNMRYKLAPSLVAAGRLVQVAGFPLTARCDLVWPEYPEANDSTQYLHLNATLVAPLEGDPPKRSNHALVEHALPTERSVWIPPGQWQDGWTGATETGPKLISVTAVESPGTYEIPMWHRRGSFLVAVAAGSQRIAEQDWNELVVEAFPSQVKTTERRMIFEQDRSGLPDNTTTELHLTTDDDNAVIFSISASIVPRSWIVRLHLHHAEDRLVLAPVDADLKPSLKHLLPSADCRQRAAPFQGPGSTPGCKGGSIAEFRIEASRGGRRVEAVIARPPSRRSPPPS